jgi:predicted RNA-binding Zn-ribbon protein involved in translation (DUF1610 family)
MKPTLVFISHNKADKDVAREIALFLAAENVNVWFDEWEISAGDSIVQEINTGLRGCTHFIILWSENASTSNWVRRELQSTLAKATQTGSPRVLPILLDNTPLPELLSDICYIRYHDGTEEDRREIVRNITGRRPSRNFIRAIVKKYHEVVYCEPGRRPDGTYDYLGIAACPSCGSDHIKHTTYSRGKWATTHTQCQECGWEPSPESF